MRNPSIYKALLIIVAATGLTACGGGGSGAGLASTPPPPANQTCPDGSVIPASATCPTPPSAQAILSAATTTQEFTSKGATFVGGDRRAPLLNDSDQLRLRYDAASNSYEIQLPATSTWIAISPTANTGDWTTADSKVTLGATEGSSTTVVYWSASNTYGITAVAIPTPASAIPTTGSASYLGSLVGYSSEIVSGEIDSLGRIAGTIQLTFNFGSGSFSGSIQPALRGIGGFPRFLPTLAFKDTVYAAGGTNFSGKFDTNVPGLNSFSGLFAGPTAGDVAGNFAFPYLSPVNGAQQQAAGAFTAHQ